MRRSIQQEGGIAPAQISPRPIHYGFIRKVLILLGKTRCRMSFDPITAAVEWLDAYRFGDIVAILALYADDAVVECSCGGLKTIAGEEALRAYWLHRLSTHRPTELDELSPLPNGVQISYLTGKGSVCAVMEFDAEGQISFVRCGPST